MTHLSSGFRQLSCALGLVGASIASAAVDFSFDYTDAAGVGFNANGSVGAERRAFLAQAGTYLSNVLGSSYNASLTFSVNGSLTADTTLASAGSAFNLSYPGAGFGTRGDVMTKILGGADPGAGADGTVNWNFEDHNWGYATVDNTQFDFLSTAIHELTHALGFASLIQQNGDSPWGDAPGTTSAWAPFDRFVADSSGSIIDSNGVLDGARWDAAKEGGTGSKVFFNGANAVAANGGQPVHLFSPSTYSPGSSISHLDDAFFSEALYIMDAQTPPGLGPRVFTNLEIGFLRDIGYVNAAPVPEPASMVALGLGALAMLRRRKKSA